MISSDARVPAPPSTAGGQVYHKQLLKLQKILLRLGQRLSVPGDGLCGLHALWSAMQRKRCTIPDAERKQYLNWLTDPAQKNSIGAERQDAIRSNPSYAQLNSTELIRLCEHLSHRAIVIELSEDDYVSALTNQDLPNVNWKGTVILLHCTGDGSGHYDAFTLAVPDTVQLIHESFKRFASRDESRVPIAQFEQFINHTCKAAQRASPVVPKRT
jgi:hypothetical protein